MSLFFINLICDLSQDDPVSISLGGDIIKDAGYWRCLINLFLPGLPISANNDKCSVVALPLFLLFLRKDYDLFRNEAACCVINPILWLVLTGGHSNP